MAKSTRSSSSLAASLGAAGQQAHEAAKNEETRYSAGGDCPAGVDNGVAQLIECKFAQYPPDHKNKNLWYFYAAGVVIAPRLMQDELGNTIKVEGLRTSITEPLYDTPERTRKTVNDHLSWIYNELRKLGVATSELEFDNLENIGEPLVAAAPTFAFRTWAGAVATEGKYKGQKPLTNHVWNGVIEHDGSATDDVQDNTATTTQTKAALQKPATTTKATTKAATEAPKATAEAKAPKAAPKAAKAATKAKEPEPAAELTAEDIVALGAVADDANDEGADAAQQQIAAEAGKRGINHEDEAFDCWTAVAQAVADHFSEEANAGTAASEDDAEDVTGLGVAADGGDADAMVKLNAIAVSLGIDADSAENWVAVEAAITEARGGEAAPPWVPAKGEVYNYTPPKAKAAIACEVTAVFEDKQTVNLKGCDNKLSYKSVAWTSLSSS